MSSEPHTFHIESELDFDGETPFTQTLSDFTPNRPNGRIHRLSVTSAFGVMDSTCFGLLSDESPKQVGVASKFNNPTSKARVYPGDDPDSFRRELDLTPDLQYVTMYPGDKLAIVTKDNGRTHVTIVVNELSESDHMALAIHKPPSLHWRRYRIIRQSPTGFKPAVNQDAWRPNFLFDRGSNLLVAHEVGQGPIPLEAFCSYPAFAGCLVRARFANVEEGRLLIVEPLVRDRRLVEKVESMVWTKVGWVSHDDHIALRSSDPSSGDTTICDLMIAKINAEDALQGLYNNGN